MFSNMTSFQSSEIDWCEPNYEYFYNIAEFWNTITSLVISFLGLFQYDLINKISVIILGLTSAYFHLSLSLLGQILDELSITFIVVVNIIKMQNLLKYTLELAKNSLYNEKYKRILKYESEIKNNNYLNYIIAIQLIVQFWYPSINRFILFFYVYLFADKFILLKLSLPNTDSWNLTIFTFIVSVFCWIIDFICSKNNSVNFHAIWHILMAITVYLIGYTIHQYEINIK